MSGPALPVHVLPVTDLHDENAQRFVIDRVHDPIRPLPEPVLVLAGEVLATRGRFAVRSHRPRGLILRSGNEWAGDP